MSNNVLQSDLKINIGDDALVAQCKAGDKSAIERLVIKYQDRVFNIILKMCGSRDDAVELTQDTFVKVLENINGFEGRSGFYTWVYRIAFNVTINHTKKQLRFESLDTEGGEYSQAKEQLRKYYQASGPDDPAAIVERKEIYKLLEQTLLKLEDNHRAVLVLRDMESLSYEQIAEVLDIEIGTVKSRISRARSNLREILESILQ